MGMRVYKRLFAAAAAAGLMTALLSVLPLAERRMGAENGEVAVFRASPVKRLGYDNLVDTMIGLQLSLPIRKADWKQGVLALDLSVEGNPQRIDIWMADLERLLALSFVQMENVNRVLVRFVISGAAGGLKDAAASRSVMQAAADIRRTDEWLNSELPALGGARPDKDPIWRQRLRMSFTPAGQPEG